MSTENTTAVVRLNASRITSDGARTGGLKENPNSASMITSKLFKYSVTESTFGCCPSGAVLMRSETLIPYRVHIFSCLSKKDDTGGRRNRRIDGEY